MIPIAPKINMPTAVIHDPMNVPKIAYITIVPIFLKKLLCKN